MAKRSKATQVFHFESDDKNLSKRSAIVKEIQKNYLTGDVLHVDFRELKAGEKIRIEVPIAFEGVAEGVKNQGGVLTVSCHSIEVSCLPKVIPEDIKLNIEELNVGDAVLAENLELPEGVDLSSNPHETIVAVVAPKVEEEPTPEAVEGEEAVAAEGTEEKAAEEKPAVEADKDKPES